VPGFGEFGTDQVMAIVTGHLGLSVHPEPTGSAGRLLTYLATHTSDKRDHNRYMRPPSPVPHPLTKHSPHAQKRGSGSSLDNGERVVVFQDNVFANLHDIIGADFPIRRQAVLNVIGTAPFDESLNAFDNITFPYRLRIASAIKQKISFRFGDIEKNRNSGPAIHTTVHATA
jgi:hypothetical protein